MKRIKYWVSAFGAAAKLLGVGGVQRDSGLALAGGFLALLGIIGLVADLRSRRE
jgi:hypothetical protein